MGPKRVVITATAQPAQRFHTIFAEYFIEGLAKGDADIDRNGRQSVYEAFAFASARVKQHYEQRGQLATERAMLDDDGDGRGLVGEAEELKKRRLMMPELEYDTLLEKLLIELALVSRDIRSRT